MTRAACVTGLKAILALALLAGATFSVAPVAASITLSVAPSRIELEGEPGSTGRQELRVYNEGDEAFAVVVAVAPYKEVVPELSAETWLTVSPDRLELEPGAEGVVTVDIAIPDDARPGGGYAAVTVTTAPAGAPSEGTVLALAGEVRVPFLVTVLGDEVLEPLAEQEGLAPVLQPDGQYAFRTAVRNVGNIHFFVEGGLMNLADAGGTLLGTLDFGLTTAILPGTAEQVVADGAFPLEPDSEYQLEATIEYGDGKSTSSEHQFTTTPELQLGTSTVCINGDLGPRMDVEIINQGTLGVAPTVSVTVRNADGQVLSSGYPGGLPLSLPGTTITVPIQYPSDLTSGDYDMTISVQAGTNEPITQSMPFRIGGLIEGSTLNCEAVQTTHVAT